MKSFSKSRNSFFRPRLEWLEGRVQPSNLLSNASPPHLAPPAVRAVPLEESRPLAFMLERLPVAVPPGGGAVHVPGPAVNQATYVTGTTGTASATGVAVDANGEQYVVGTLDDGTKSGYVAEYHVDPGTGMLTQDTFVRFQARGVRFDGTTVSTTDTEGHAIAVDSAGNLYVAGTAVNADTAVRNNSYLMKLSNDATTSLAVINFGPVAAGPVAANSENAVALDNAGHVATAGLYSPTPDETDISYADCNTADLSLVGGPMHGAYYYRFLSGTSVGSGGLGVALRPDGTAITLTGYSVPRDPTAHLSAVALFNSDPVGSSTFFVLGPLDDPDGDAVIGAAATDAANDVYLGSTIATPGGGTVADVTKFAWPDLDVPPTSVWEYRSADTTTTLNGMALGGAGNVYLTGSSRDAGGNTRVLLTWLTDAGATVTESGVAQVGGTAAGAADVGLAIAADASGNLYVVGTTTSPDFPVGDGSMLNGTRDGFLLNFTFP
jgi:hypothetical protein